jgi:hypothetical protein
MNRSTAGKITEIRQGLPKNIWHFLQAERDRRNIDNLLISAAEDKTRNIELETHALSISQRFRGF